MTGIEFNSQGVLAAAQMTECQLIAAQVDASHRSKVEENVMFIIAGVQISLHYTLGPLLCPLLFHQARQHGGLSCWQVH